MENIYNFTSAASISLVVVVVAATRKVIDFRVGNCEKIGKIRQKQLLSPAKLTLTKLTLFPSSLFESSFRFNCWPKVSFILSLNLLMWLAKALLIAAEIELNKVPLDMVFGIGNKIWEIG